MLRLLDRSRPLAYLAAPLFSESELAFNRAVTERLETYIDISLPQRDGGKLIDLVAQGVSRSAAYKSIFDRDVEAIRGSDALIIILDGRVIDEGAAFELGYAHALGKLCVALLTDPRRLLPVGNNPMIEVPLSRICGSVDELVSWAKSFSENALVGSDSARYR